MILGIFRVFGHSMVPYLTPGDRVFVSSIPYYFSKPKVGDVVVFAKDGKILIKRIAKISNDGIFVEGDNKSDSLKVNAINKTQVLGKVCLIIK